MATRFILRLRLSTEHHYAFKPSPCLKRVEFPLNEQIFNTIGIIIQASSNQNLKHKIMAWRLIP
ncbi:hypothetical protein SIL85_11220 [Shewanella oneidensis]|uniref:hypothetical protein n=1 Tax=Shewanella oneidensis TaxID=70863 RepID=UPI0002D54AF1|nr:hypothetical protein [Shewanella oneidensis]MDX5997615.1 hypothetical protein [Shewanella oneidensis]